MNLNDLLLVWTSKPAKWYQFWLPQSGYRGGLILGAILAALLV